MKDRGPAIDPALEYLRGYLEEEFRVYSDVRVRFVLPATTQRAVDLEQDYDPASSNIHSQRGVLVKVGSREEFFPAEWATGEKFKLVAKRVAEIKDRLG